MALIQLDFFEKDEVSGLKAEVQECKDSANRVRKSLFAKNGELKKEIEELKIRLEIIERNICHGK